MTKIEIEIGTEDGLPVYAELIELSEDGKDCYLLRYGKDLTLSINGRWISREWNMLSFAPEDVIWGDRDAALAAAKATLR
jgi:hypothetical protein